jgi:hypothetical protein
VHILEGYIIYIHSRHTLSSDFRTETHKKKLFARSTLGYVSGVKKLCIFTANRPISKSSNMKQKQYDLDVQETQGYTILTNRGETISNTHYTATACPLSDSLLSQASDSQVFQ